MPVKIFKYIADKIFNENFENTNIPDNLKLVDIITPSVLKVTVFGVILVYFFLHSDQNNSEYGQFLRRVQFIKKIIVRIK